MKNYIGVKMIMGEQAMNVKKELGYNVLYGDGYLSWSPQKAFEDAYVRTDVMSFGLAFEAMRMGFRVTRPEWIDHRYLHITKDKLPPYGEVIEQVRPRLAGDISVVWTPHQEALLANDYVLLLKKDYK